MGKCDLNNEQLKITGRVTKDGVVFSPASGIPHQFHSACGNLAAERKEDCDSLSLILRLSVREAHAQNQIVKHFGKWAGGLVISIARKINCGRPVLHLGRVLDAINSDFDLEDVLEFQMEDIEQWGERP